jgi:hypothetical protein
MSVICEGHNQVTASLSSNFQDARTHHAIAKMPTQKCRLSSAAATQFIAIKYQTQIHFQVSNWQQLLIQYITAQVSNWQPLKYSSVIKVSNCKGTSI